MAATTADGGAAVFDPIADALLFVGLTLSRPSSSSLQAAAAAAEHHHSPAVAATFAALTTPPPSGQTTTTAATPSPTHPLCERRQAVQNLAMITVLSDAGVVECDPECVDDVFFNVKRAEVIERADADSSCAFGLTSEVAARLRLGKKQYRCPFRQCRAAFGSAYFLFVHRLRQHRDRTVSVCHRCRRAFGHPDSLRQHLATPGHLTGRRLLRQKAV